MELRTDDVSAPEQHVRAFTPSFLRPDDRETYLAVRDYFTGHGLDVTVHGSALKGDQRYSDIDLALSGDPESIGSAISGLSHLERLPRSRVRVGSSKFERATGYGPFVMARRDHPGRYLGMAIDGDIGFIVGNSMFDVSLFNDR